MQQPRHSNQRRIAIAIEIDQNYPQHQDLFAGIQRYVQQDTDWSCVIDEHPMASADRRGDSYRAYDGVIARATPKLCRRLNRLGIPLVNIHYQAKDLGTHGVYPDAVNLGRMAADHLIERNFRQLSFFRDSSHSHACDIYRSFREHAESLGITCQVQDHAVESFLDEKYWLKTEKQFDHWLDGMSPPVGVYFEEAASARLMIQRCQARDWDVPRDVAMLCQQNYKEIIEVPPQISSVVNNYERIGYEAAQMLGQLMSGEPVRRQEVFVPAWGIVGRETTDFFAVEDQLVSEALRYIASNLKQPLYVDDVADRLVVSASLLQLRFKNALGRGVSEEIRRLRLALAKRLLAHSDKLISEIATDSGFGRAQLLNAVFRRELGISPSEYRKQVLGENKLK
jgi:LacI family transcriptional regulator